MTEPDPPLVYTELVFDDGVRAVVASDGELDEDQRLHLELVMRDVMDKMERDVGEA